MFIDWLTVTCKKNKLREIDMFSGSIVALVTPFNTDGEVDFDSLKKLVDHHVAAGISLPDHQERAQVASTRGENHDTVPKGSVVTRYRRVDQFAANDGRSASAESRAWRFAQSRQISFA